MDYKDGKSMKEKKNILVVDDSEINLEFVKKALEDSYCLTLIQSGKQALEYLEKTPVDMVLLDILMPELDGFEIYRRIKKLEQNQNVPVVFITADMDVESEIKGLAMGAKDFIRKPFVPAVMKNRIDNIMRLEELTRTLETKVREKTAENDQLSFEIIATIASIIEAKDSYTKGHSARVAEYSAMLAKELGWKEADIQNLKYIALLHDIGKIGIPDHVLNKPGKLTEMEFNIIKSHTTIGGDILKDIKTIRHVDSGARYHHEKFDGSGYPTSISGTVIPAVARIICITDAYDAMNSKRVYRDVMSQEAIREELIQGKGKQFDPDYLDVFLKLLDEGRLVPVSAKEKEKNIAGEGSDLIRQIMQSIEEEAKKKDERDYLTGLLGRKAGETQIIEAMKTKGGCLVFTDLDNLKRTNDTMGHLAGDYALMTVGEVLSEHGENAVVLRLGGDEFVLFMSDVTKEEATKRMEQIFESFRQRKKQSAYLSVSALSAGLCMVNAGDSYPDALSKADKALYYVKQRGKSDYYFYQNSLNEVQKGSSGDLNRLVSSLKQQGSYTGSLNVEYREFAKIYDFVNHLTERYEHGMQLIMITLQPAAADTLYLDEIEYAMSCMEKTIQASLRTVDVCTRFSSEQFLVILMDADDAAVSSITRRIFANFVKTYDGKEMMFDYEIAELPKKVKQ